MPETLSFEEFLSSQTTDLPVLGFAVNLLLAALMSVLLARLYVRCGRSLSNRESFAANFMLITLATVVVISIVKSSLALSLGLVGALSIVRFRSAIKEPEELAYLFLAIAIGLGFGAGQWVVTTTAFLLIAGLLLVKHRFERQPDQQNLYITVEAKPSETDPVSLDDIAGVLADTCRSASLTRFDEREGMLEAAFHVEVDDYQQLSTAKNELSKIDDRLGISFLDGRSIA